MILSVSRRTDIPNYYSEWFYNRIKEGFLYVRNPMNAHQISEIKITPDVVDSELIKLLTFEERFQYLNLDGVIGRETFGFKLMAEPRIVSL